VQTSPLTSTGCLKGLECLEDEGGSAWSSHRNKAVLKLEESSSYKIDHMPSFGLWMIPPTI
jgi:hypothetical protein